MKFKVYFLLSTVIMMSLVVGAQNTINGTITYQDDEETPMQNVEMKLFDNLDQLIETTFTDAAGYYEFNGLPDGDYYIKCNTDETPEEVGNEDAAYLLQYLQGAVEFDAFEMDVFDIDGDDDVDDDDYDFHVIDHQIEGLFFPAGKWCFTPLVAQFNGNGNSRNLGGKGNRRGARNAAGGRSRPQSVVEKNMKDVLPVFQQEAEVELFIKGVAPIKSMNLVLAYDADIEILDIKSEWMDRWLIRDQKLMVIMQDKEALTDELKLSVTFRNTGLTQRYVDLFSVYEQTFALDAAGDLISGLEISYPEVYLEESKLDMAAAAAHLNLYPNPASSGQWIQFGREVRSFSLFDMNGRELPGFGGPGFKGTEFSTASLSPGIYVIRIETQAEEFFSERIVIQ